MKSNESVTGMSGAEALLRTLTAMGVDTIFASPGSDWAPLWEALAKVHGEPGIPRYLSVRHESAAVAMASGYAKSTGKLPAVVVHTTVGVLHATMAIRAALHERVPMVILAGESVGFGEPPSPPMGRQWMRLLADVGGPARLVEPTVKWTSSINVPDLLPATIARACQLAVDSPPGPVFVGVSVETLMHTMAGQAPAMNALPVPSTANAAAIDALAVQLALAKSPLIITEELGKNAAAVPRLVEVAELLGAPVIEAWHPDYINFPRTHPLYGGVAVDEMAERVRAADLVLAVDAVAPWHPPSSLPVGATRVAWLGESPLHPHLGTWNYRADWMLPGDAAGTLEALATALRKHIKPGSRGAAIEHLRGEHQTRRDRIHAKARAAGERAVIESAWVAHELAAVLPADAIVVNETITHRLALHDLLDTLAPGQFFESSYGGLGMGLGTALGVKVTAPNRPVVLAIGDGGFHYNPVVGALGAAQELGLPILVLLFNNAGYASQKGDVLNEFPNGHAVRTGRFAGTSIAPRPDYPLLAQAYGGVGETVRAPNAVRAAIQRGFDAIAGGRLALIEFILAPTN